MSNRGNRFTARPSQVVDAVDGTAAQSRIDELQRQLAGQQAQVQDLQERLEQAVEITRDKQDEFASVAQAEGVSLSVARRLLQVVAGVGNSTPSVPTLGRATEEAGQRAGQLLEVLDEVAQPKVKQATADEIFLGRKPVLMLVEPGSLCWVGGRMVEARDGPTWAVEFARFSALSGRRPGRWQRPGQGAEAGACPTSRRRTAGSRGFAGHLSHVPRGWPCPADDLGAASRALERAEAAQKELDRRAVRENRGPATPRGQAACGVRPRGFGIRRWPPRRPGS